MLFQNLPQTSENFFSSLLSWLKRVGVIGSYRPPWTPPTCCSKFKKKTSLRWCTCINPPGSVAEREESCPVEPLSTTTLARAVASALCRHLGHFPSFFARRSGLEKEQNFCGLRWGGSWHGGAFAVPCCPEVLLPVRNVTFLFRKKKNPHKVLKNSTPRSGNRMSLLQLDKHLAVALVAGKDASMAHSFNSCRKFIWQNWFCSKKHPVWISLC